MNDREMRDHIKKLLATSLTLKELSRNDNLTFEKSNYLRQQHEEAYNKWLFYKNLQQELSKSKSR